MSQTLIVRLKKAEGALTRLLGLAGRRGYDVLGLEARLTDDGSAFEVRMEFDSITPEGKPGHRPPEILVKFVARQFDVERVGLAGQTQVRGSFQKPSDNGAAGAPAAERKPAGKKT